MLLPCVLNRKARGGYCHFCLAKHSRRWRHKNANKYKEWHKTWRKAIKILVLNWYGGKCVCCGEKEFDFLSLDHIKDDGFKERKYIITKKGKLYVKGTGGVHTYITIRKNGFSKRPKNLQILCFNCQMGKRFNYGFCSHHPRTDLRKSK